MDLSIISEEKESKMYQSYMHVDLLEIINFTNNTSHDIKLL